MVFYTDFGLSSGSIGGVHSDTANPVKKKAYVPKPLTLVLAVLVLYKNICSRKKSSKGNCFLTFRLPAEKPVNSLFVAPAVTPVKNVWQMESNNPGVRLYQYDLLDYSLLVSKDFKALFKTLNIVSLKITARCQPLSYYGYWWNFGAYSYFSSWAKEGKSERELGQSFCACRVTHSVL